MFSGAGLNRPYGVAVDQLGNVWVTNEGNDSLTVFIGAGGVPPGGRIYTGG
jgi:DNA-binding beta-propeller fold protein YncE